MALLTEEAIIVLVVIEVAVVFVYVAVVANNSSIAHRAPKYLTKTCSPKASKTLPRLM